MSMSMRDFRMKVGNERFRSQLHPHVVVKTSNLVISGPLVVICREPQNYFLKFVLHLQHDYL